MQWYNYVAAFFAGAFLSNAIPHFINGVSGNKFPTPFAKPPGRGLSSPIVNVLWATFNLVIGWLLIHPGKLHSHERLAHVVFAVGFITMALMLSSNFSKKFKE